VGTVCAECTLGTTNATTGLSPWTLVFGRLPRGPLTILKNHWISTEKLLVSFGKSATEYLQGVQKKLEIARDYAATHSEREQERCQKYHNLRSADKHFDIGEQVLILQPDTTASKLFSKWCGPATIVAIRSPYSYEVDLNGTVRHYHANHLRKYHVRVASVLYDASVYQFSRDDFEVVSDGDDVANPAARVCVTTAVVNENDGDFGHIESVPLSLHKQACELLPSEMIDLSTIQHLTKKQQDELLNLRDHYASCFADGPDFTNVVSHSIPLMEGFRPKRLPAYRVPEKLKPEVNRQIQEMLSNNIIRPSESPMASPIVCVMKGKDGSEGVRLAIDYRYVNKFTHNDAFPMPDLHLKLKSQTVGSHLCVIWVCLSSTESRVV